MSDRASSHLISVNSHDAIRSGLYFIKVRHISLWDLVMKIIPKCRNTPNCREILNCPFHKTIKEELIPVFGQKLSLTLSLILSRPTRMFSTSTDSF